jgi:hypothetical protein
MRDSFVMSEAKLVEILKQVCEESKFSYFRTLFEYDVYDEGFEGVNSDFTASGTVKETREALTNTFGIVYENRLLFSNLDSITQREITVSEESLKHLMVEFGLQEAILFVSSQCWAGIIGDAALTNCLNPESRYEAVVGGMLGEFIIEGKVIHVRTDSFVEPNHRYIKPRAVFGPVGGWGKSRRDMNFEVTGNVAKLSSKISLSVDSQKLIAIV